MMVLTQAAAILMWHYGKCVYIAKLCMHISLNGPYTDPVIWFDDRYWTYRKYFYFYRISGIPLYKAVI